MTEALRLFDVSDLGGETTTKERRAFARRTASDDASSPLVEPHVEPWLLIRDRGGVKPFFHLVRARADTGAVVTVCGIMGNQISNVGVDQMVRCPGCDVGSQVDQLSLI
jgi:hypothetical protein